MTLEFRSVNLSEDQFNSMKPKAVSWDEITPGDYIECNRHPSGDSLSIWANDIVVQEIIQNSPEVGKTRIRILNPGRDEVVERVKDSIYHYGLDWYLVQPKDYSGSRE